MRKDAQSYGQCDITNYHHSLMGRDGEFLASVIVRHMMSHDRLGRGRWVAG